MVLRPRPINELFPMSDFASLQAPSGLSGSISGSISSQRSYGATRAGLDNTETKFFVHFVEVGDTLQRIAIKYGVSVRSRFGCCFQMQITCFFLKSQYF